MIKNKISQARRKATEELNGPMDGSVYQNFIKKYEHDIVISLIVNTDGAPVAYSGNYLMWPVLATIIELDQNCPDKFTNMPSFKYKCHIKFIRMLGGKLFRI